MDVRARVNCCVLMYKIRVALSLEAYKYRLLDRTDDILTKSATPSSIYRIQRDQVIHKLFSCIEIVFFYIYSQVNISFLQSVK